VLNSDEDVRARSLQTPDDPEAPYRRKAGRRYRGYVANVTETCDEANELQLIVDVAVEPNSADDGQMLVDAVEGLTERTEVGTLFTDGGYNGPQVDGAMARHPVELYQTGIRGGRAPGYKARRIRLGGRRRPEADRSHLSWRAAERR